MNEYELMLIGPRYESLFSSLRISELTADHKTRFAEYRHRELARRNRAKEDGTPLALTVAGDQARVSVYGLLTETPDLWAWFFDEPNTLYSDIADAIYAVERDTKIRHVTFDIESGGGTVAGLRTATSAIDAMKKSRSVSSSFAASAAYWIGTQVGQIEAKHDLSEFGSIGVAVRMAKLPVIFDIASTNAPNKRPDPSTAEGQAIVRLELDAIHEKFAAAVASGRSRATGKQVTLAEVNGSYGQGGMILAEDALKRGMIDAIRSSAETTRGRVSVFGGTPTGPTSGRKKMDAKTLKEQHPDTYDAIFNAGRDAGMRDGLAKVEEASKSAAEAAVAKERDRVNSHLTYGTKIGKSSLSTALNSAIKAVKDGTPISDTVISEYLTTKVNEENLSNREEESAALPPTNGSGQPTPTAPGAKSSYTSAVVAHLREGRGKAGK